MPSYLIASSYPPGAEQLKNVTNYYSVVGWLYPYSIETLFQFVARDTYTLSKLYVRVIANTITAGSNTTVSSRKNAVDGNQSVSINGGTTGAFTDSVNTDSLANGDLFQTKVVTPNAGTSITFSVMSYILSTTSNTTPILGCVGVQTLNTASTRYEGIAGFLANNDIESNTYYTFRVASILSNLRCRLYTNSITATTTLKTKNGANYYNQSISIPASTTGFFEDTVNTDSVSVGGDVHFEIVTGATGTSQIWSLIQMKSSSAGRQIAAMEPAGVGQTGGTTRYAAAEGFLYPVATEANTQMTARASFTAKNMYLNIPSNGVAGSSTFTLRKDTASSALTVSVPASTTGQFEDQTHTVSFVADSLINWQAIAGGASGTYIYITCIGFELPQAGPVTTGKKPTWRLDPKPRTRASFYPTLKLG